MSTSSKETKPDFNSDVFVKGCSNKAEVVVIEGVDDTGTNDSCVALLNKQSETCEEFDSDEFEDVEGKLDDKFRWDPVGVDLEGNLLYFDDLKDEDGPRDNFEWNNSYEDD